MTSSTISPHPKISNTKTALLNLYGEIQQLKERVEDLEDLRDLNEAIEVANNVEYGLTSSIYTNDIKNAFTAIQKIEAGIVYVNSSTIGAEVHLPFGGVKGTGNGTREAGIEGIHEFSETKTVYVDYSGKLQKAQGIE